MIETLGFLSMQFEAAEKRDFRPGFFAKLAGIPQQILLDHGYGAKLGYTPDDYLKVNPRIALTDRREVLRADCVISIRTPDFAELEQLKRGAVFFSMLHYLTRKIRNELLLGKGIVTLSMDSIVDDFGLRVIEDFTGTVHNAFETAYELFMKEFPGSLINVLILGTGALGKICVDLAINMSPVPAVVTSVGEAVTSRPQLMDAYLEKTDILVDASKRFQTASHIISNRQIGLMPHHALLLDISADDYDVRTTPIQVKGIEGIPTGNLDQYVFYPDDPAYGRLPAQVSSQNRRLLVSCNAWPGVNPHRCLDRYEKQLLPYVELLTVCGKPEFSPDATSPFERALARSTYQYFRDRLPTPSTK